MSTSPTLDSWTFETLTAQIDAVLFADISAPPMNLLGPELVRDLVSLIKRAEADDALKVLVFQSADPDYFISHVDVTPITEYRAQATRLVGEPSIALMFRYLGASRPVSIAQIEGRVRGAGSEFVLACDTRFAARESAIFGQFEPAFGAIPGGGAARRTTTRNSPPGTAGSTERCRPTGSASSSAPSTIASQGFRPLATSRSRSESMRSHSRQRRTSGTIPISSTRDYARARGATRDRSRDEARLPDPRSRDGSGPAARHPGRPALKRGRAHVHKEDVQSAASSKTASFRRW